MFLALALFADTLRLWMGPAPPLTPAPTHRTALPRSVARDVRDACTAAERADSPLTPDSGAQILAEGGPWTRLV